MPRPSEAVSVRHPEAPMFVVLNPAVDYAADDVLVKAYPWAFGEKATAELVESVAIEKAEARPGQKRSRTRRS